MSTTFSKVFDRDNHRCVYCGKDMLVDLDTLMSVEEDHLLPRSANGSNDADNIVTSCNVCNRLKGNYKPEGIEVSDRARYISAVRAEILDRRAKKLKEFMSWSIPGEDDYYT